MNKYKVRVYLVTSVDVEIKAENEEEAIEEAKASDNWEGEVSDILGNLSLDESCDPDILED